MKSKLLIGISCISFFLLAYFAWKIPFYEYAQDLYESGFHPEALFPFGIILLLSTIGILLCIYIRKIILRKDRRASRFLIARTAKTKDRPTGQKVSVFMMIRWTIMIIGFFLIIYGGILFGLHFSNISIPAFFCPVNEEQLTSASCYLLAHLDELLQLPIKNIMLFLVSTIGFTIFFGRMICGFLCPLGLVQDITHTIRQKTKTEGISMTEKMYRTLLPIKWTLVFLMLGLVFVGGNFCNFCPAITLSPAFTGMKVSLYFNGFLMIFILIGSFFKRRLWCNVCPLGFLLGLFYKISPFRIKKDCQSCTECGACYEACPMGIKIIYTERENKDVTDMNCIMCGECVKKCPEDHALSMTFAGLPYYSATRRQAISGYSIHAKKTKKGEKYDKSTRK